MAIGVVLLAACFAQEVRLVGPGGGSGDGDGGSGATQVLTITPGSATVGRGSSVPLVATLRDAGGTIITGQTVTWATTNPTIVSITQSGIATGQGVGTAGVTATSGSASAAAAITVVPEPVATMEVSPTSATLELGFTFQLTATPRNASGQPLTGRAISWSSSNGAVVNILDATGLVRANALGTATITATSEGRSATATLTVTRTPVATVVVSPPTATMPVGATLNLAATTLDASGNTLTGRTVTWSSAATGVASVNGSGVVTGTGAGTTTITATSEGVPGTMTVTVQIVPVATVTVTPITAGLLVGGTQQYAATTRDANGNLLTGRAIAWASGNTAVATVNTTGLATGVALGTTTITATSEGRTGTSSLTVSLAPPTLVRVILTPDTAIVNTGAQRQFTAQGRMSDSTTVPISATFSATGGSVNATGLYTAGTTPGTAFRVIASSGGRADTSQVTVVLVPVASVTVAPVAGSILVGSTLQYSATLRDAGGNVLTGRTVTWQSANTAVATINGNGLATGVTAGGPVTITASSGGQSGTASITVNPRTVASVTVTPGSAGIGVAQTLQLTATLRDGNGQVFTGPTVTWATSNGAAATVNATGLVTGAGAGTTTITASAGGQSGTATITVTAVQPPPPPPVGEPVYTPGVNTSMFFDGFESYPSTAALETGPGDYRYVTNWMGLSGIAVVTGGAFEGQKKVTFDFRSAGELDRLLETYSVGNGGDVVHLSYVFRDIGTVHHEKQFITFGARRFVYNIWGIVAPLSLASCFYNGGLYGTPKTADIPPQGHSAPGWNADPTGYQYQQNMGYLVWKMNNVINDGSWHRYTSRFTRELSGSGTGRIEVWADGIKIIEYLGDNPSRCEYQKVYTAGPGQEMIDGFQFPTTTSGQFTWDGGATLEYDAIRIWR